jgi:hypothetical protein
MPRTKYFFVMPFLRRECIANSNAMFEDLKLGELAVGKTLLLNFP